MREIQLSQGKVAIVDDSDYEIVRPYGWFAHFTHGRNWYAHARKPANERIQNAAGQNLLMMHRLILGVSDRCILIDHINGNGLDNRRANLRLADYSQNNANKRVVHNNTSGYRGVTFSRRSKKWQAQIQHAGKCHYLGLYELPEKAALAYNDAAKMIYGSFAVMNEVV